MRRKLISIVDDDESMLVALKALLRSMGFDVNTFTSALQYIDTCVGQEPCCIITDIQMPGMCGFEFKRWLDSHGSTVPIIMVTALSEPRIWTQANATGIVGLLKKPFDAKELLSCLKRANVVG